MEILTGGPELLQRKGQYSQVNIGDATHLTSLHTIARGKPAVIIDNNLDGASALLHELETEQPVFSFLSTAKNQREGYASIDRKILQDSEKAREMRDVYKKAWEDAKNNLHLLTMINSSIKDVVDTIKKPVRMADEVTYYYPSAIFNPRFKALELASLILAPGGHFTVVSENSDIIDSFHKFAEPFVTSVGYVLRKGKYEYISAYDIAWGQEGRREIQITNSNGELPVYIANLKKGMIFKALSWAHMIQ